MTRPVGIHVEKRASATVLRCVGASRPLPLQEKVAELASSGERAIVLDMRRVDSFDMIAVSQILVSFVQTKKKGVEIRVVVDDTQRRACDMVHLTKAIGGIYSDVDEALRSFEGVNGVGHYGK